jgi:hypothetical protein
MNGKLLLSFAVATFIAALASVWVLADVRRRLDALERGPAAAPERRPSARASGDPEPTSMLGPRDLPFQEKPADVPPAGPSDDPAVSTDPLVKLNYLIEKLNKVSDELYDAMSEQSSSTMDLNREVRYLKQMVKNITQALKSSRGAAGLGITDDLAPHGQPLSAEIAKAYTEAAQRWGYEVAEGRVTAPAMLNMSPRKDFPIEYFITRFPESGHETLVHLTGKKPLEELARSPGNALKGLGTGLYKALVAAGFKEGRGTHRDEASPDRNKPRWVLPTGDTVWLYVRYTHGGKTHLARATDWVIDPSTGTVLPEDCFRFTGSLRYEDPNTGDEMLAAEQVGLLVSVWPNELALIEVALDSTIHNDYQYHSARIPKPDGEGPLMLDLVFSKTRLEPEGDGALPLPPPSPRPPEPAPAEPPVKPGDR